MSDEPQEPFDRSRPAPAGPSKGAQIAIGALLVGGLLGWYGYTNVADESFTYYQTLEEFNAASASVSGQGLRVHGYVATASIERNLAEKQVRFVVQNDPPHAAPTGSGSDAELAVLYRSLETPDLFKDGAEVVVEGRLQGRGGDAVFVADNVMAKCPSKFQAVALAEADGEPL
jgi:cytochrome c-type biogenesis protein CcmE